MGLKMKKVMKVLVPILVLALLIQLPLSASATTSPLSEGSKLEFDVTAAPEGSPANTLVKLYLTTNSTDGITTVASTLVLKDFDNNFELFNGVDDDGDDNYDRYVDASDSYKVVKTQLGEAFPISATEVLGDQFYDFPSASLASYNATTGEMYLFIAAWNDGLEFQPGTKTEIASFYIQAKDGVTPSNDNLRVMKQAEFKNPDYCLCNAVYPTAISSSDVVLQPTVDDMVADDDFTIDFPTPGPINGIITGTFACNYNNSADVTIKLMSGDVEVAQTTATGSNPDYTFLDVAPGTYEIVMSASGSLGFSIINIVVNENETTTIPSVTLLFGDYDGDGTVSVSDFNYIITAYSTNDYSVKADVDGDGVISVSDINYAISHYLKMDTEQVLDLSAV